MGGFKTVVEGSHRVIYPAVCMAQRPLPKSFSNSVILIDKPVRVSSHQAVLRIGTLLEMRKVAACSSLDKMASGVMLVLTGEACKWQSVLEAGAKEYEGKMTLGAVTPSYDTATPVDPSSYRNTSFLTDESIDQVRKLFVGAFMQRPPVYSSVRIRNQKTAFRSKKHHEIEERELLPRKVFVTHFEIKERNGPELSFLLKCCKSCFPRSIVHDFGKALGVGAHITQLRRTGLADAFDVREAWDLEDLEVKLKQGKDIAQVNPIVALKQKALEFEYDALEE